MGGQLQFVALVGKGRIRGPAGAVLKFGYGSRAFAAWKNCAVHSVVRPSHGPVERHHTSFGNSCRSLDAPDQRTHNRCTPAAAARRNYVTAYLDVDRVHAVPTAS